MRATLADRAVIVLSGDDTRTFLQGLITNDIERLTPTNPLYAALLTPQGKILFDFFLIADAFGRVYLDCVAALREALIKRLTLYRLRAKVMIERGDDFLVVAGCDVSLPTGGFIDPRFAALGWRIIGPREWAAGTDDYLAHRLNLGVPEGMDFGQDKMFALDAGLEELYAVAFDKGCYVGQELTARMKHRGTARKRLLPVVAADGGDLAAGAVLAGAVNIGEIASTYGARGFALLRLDRLDEAVDAPLTANGTVVTVSRPAWLAA
ncbi:MAG TPA: hypothetical protein VH000_11605 [Rhizomicrobium sp.]|jgi:hypothetical protein|nr:hypothetical protein [Rhizomicrobium sp.]